MKVLVPLLLLCIIDVVAAAQKTKKESYYVYDSEWNPCEIGKASYLAYVEELSDTNYRWNFYHFKGQLMSVETYSDKEAKMPNGYFAWYDKNGLIDSSGYSTNGKKNGTWYIFSDTLSVITEMEYSNGVLVKTIDQSNAENRQQPDSLPGDKEASFKGGFKAWSKYLEKNIKYPDRALNLNKFGKVMIDFTIDNTGKVEFSKVAKSVEFSLDREAIRLIEESSDWIPAIREGKKVKAFRRQPITFSKPE